MAKGKKVATSSAKAKSSAKSSSGKVKGTVLPSLEKLKGLAAPTEVPEEKAKGGVKAPGGRIYETQYAEDRRPLKKRKVKDDEEEDEDEEEEEEEEDLEEEEEEDLEEDEEEDEEDDDEDADSWEDADAEEQLKKAAQEKLKKRIKKHTQLMLLKKQLEETQMGKSGRSSGQVTPGASGQRPLEPTPPKGLVSVPGKHLSKSALDIHCGQSPEEALAEKVERWKKTGDCSHLSRDELRDFQQQFRYARSRNPELEGAYAVALSGSTGSKQKAGRKCLLAWLKNPGDISKQVETLHQISGKERLQKKEEWVSRKKFLEDYSDSEGEEMLELAQTRANPMNPKRKQWKKITIEELQAIEKNKGLAVRGQAAVKDATALEDAMRGFKLQGLGNEQVQRMLGNVAEAGLDYDKATADADFSQYCEGQRKQLLKAIEDGAGSDAETVSSHLTTDELLAQKMKEQAEAKQKRMEEAKQKRADKEAKIGLSVLLKATELKGLDGNYMEELLKEAKRLGQMIFNQSFKAQSKLESNNSFNRTWKMNFLKMHEQLEKAYKDMNAEGLVKLPEKKILEKIQTLAKAVGGQKDNLKQLK